MLVADDIHTDILLNKDENAIITTVAICSPNEEYAKEYKALWDTGSQNSSISKRVADELHLCQVTTTNTIGATGNMSKPVYLINFAFNSVQKLASNIYVTGDINMPGDFDVIIGMDIIKLGKMEINTNDHALFFRFKFR